MSLKLRLLLTLGITLVIVWAATAAWLMRGLEDKFVETLDQRLAQSARMVAALVQQLPPDAWEQRIQQTLSIPPIEGLACQVHSPRGEVIARTHANLGDVLVPGQQGHTYRREDNVTWRVFTYERDGLVITTADRMDERNLLLREVFRAAVMPFVVALIGSLLMLWLGVWRGLAPLDRLRAALARRHPEALAPIATYGLPKELRPLINTLNGLLVRTQQAMVREQRFTNDAAHELRTPLTAIKTHLQVARRLKNDTADQALSHAEEGVQRLSRTLDQLLTLARIEGQQAVDDAPYSVIEEIIERAVGDTGLPERFVLPTSFPAVYVKLPSELAITALRNLLDNALQHAPSESSITVQADCSTDRQDIVLRVRDHGPGAPAEMIGNFTQRFWRAGEYQGSGLGLTIVAAIVGRFRGHLRLYNADDGGLVAELTLPASHIYAV